MNTTTCVLGALSAEPGTKIRAFLPVPDTDIQIPCTIINSTQKGPTLLFTAGIHGGEYPGIAALMDLGSHLEPDEIQGCLIMLHPVNIRGFWKRIPNLMPDDGKNLNRVFPGDPDGTASEKVAAFLSKEVFPLADFYADLHSGDIHEELHPYVYYPGIADEEIVQKSRAIAKLINVEFMVRSNATTGAYNSAAIQGLPSILIERGHNGICYPSDVAAYKEDLENIMCAVGILPYAPKPCRYYPHEVENMLYLEADSTSCWRCQVHPGDFVYKGQTLGTMSDIFGTVHTTYLARQDGIILYVCPTLAVTKGTILCAYGKIALAHHIGNEV